MRCGATDFGFQQFIYTAVANFKAVIAIVVMADRNLLIKMFSGTRKCLMFLLALKTDGLE